jgi:hypothetical protein
LDHAAADFTPRRKAPRFDIVQTEPDHFAVGSLEMLHCF